MSASNSCAQKIVIFLFLFVINSTAHAYDEGSIELYVKVHLSLDRADDAGDGSTSLSDNSSRFGFQGEHRIEENSRFIWRMEQKVHMDESDGNFGSPAYAGFQLPEGRVLLGFIDTPYKSFVSKFNVMDDSIADVRSILGYSSLGDNATDKLNIRARNAVLYSNEWNKLHFSALYSAENGDTGAANGTDDNAESGSSAHLEYVDDTFRLGMAAEEWHGGQQLRGIRIGGRYDVDEYTAGLVLERIESPLNANYSRDAYAIDIGYVFDDSHHLKLQYLKASNNENQTRSGADMLSLADYYSYTKALSFYLIASNIHNQANAAYRMGTSGHGDIVSPDYGNDIWALSFGLIYKIKKSF